jgi:hypothetical protein
MMTIAIDATGMKVIGRAIMQKFLGSIYGTLKNNWVVDDSSNFALREARKELPWRRGAETS